MMLSIDYCGFGSVSNAACVVVVVVISGLRFGMTTKRVFAFDEAVFLVFSGVCLGNTSRLCLVRRRGEDLVAELLSSLHSPTSPPLPVEAIFLFITYSKKQKFCSMKEQPAFRCHVQVTR